ncbi:MAG: DUF6600 domain-containing protein [Burkholderiales bacterium]
MFKHSDGIKFFRLAILASFAALPLAARSAIPPDPSPSNPPARVARLDFFSGNVIIEPAGAQTWSHAELNWPLTTGDQLWTGSAGRAELQIGSSALRINRKTAFDIVNLDDRNLQVKVAQGSLAARLRTLAPGQDIEIDTPNLALQATNPGSYRVDVAPGGNATTVTVRSGTAMLYGDHTSLMVPAGQQIRFVGTHLQQYTGTTEPLLDGFDAWAAQRDAGLNSTISAQYVSPDMTGYQDLDANGTWQDTQAYGPVWIPAVAMYSGWAPYREGRWAWIAPWGWTWIDAEPWGFAPFHYGRWAQIGGVWGWVPGMYARIWSPVYAPALVGFVGGGAMGWGINMRFGAGIGPGIAWLPLGPGENWYPAYGASRNYFNRVNNINANTVRNTTIINNTTIIDNRNNRNYYRNRNIPGAITAIPARSFVRGMPVARAAIPLSAHQIARAPIIGSEPAIAPVKTSFLGGMRPTTAIGLPRHIMQRQVIATRAPVIPPAYRDVLAQRYADRGGYFAGAGKPVVRNIAVAKIAAGTLVHPADMSMPQTFHVIDRAQAQRHDVRSWQAGSGKLRSNGGNAAVSAIPATGNAAMRQNREAAHSSAQPPAGTKHDFQELHLPPANRSVAGPGEHRPKQTPNDFNHANEYPHSSDRHSHDYPGRNEKPVHVPAEQQHRIMQRENYGQQSYFGNERNNQRVNAQRMQPQNQAMPAPIRSAPPAETINQRTAPAPRPRAPVYPRTQSSQHD